MGPLWSLILGVKDQVNQQQSWGRFSKGCVILENLPYLGGDSTKSNRGVYFDGLKLQFKKLEYFAWRDVLCGIHQDPGKRLC